MGVEVEEKTEKVQGTIWKIDMLTFGRITVSLPLGSLLFCFVTAVIFKFDEVNETMCKTQNVIPSISAVTGVSPQRYVWRVCIALHSTPRFAVGFLYWNYYQQRLKYIKESQQGWYRTLVRFNFWVYTVENACLVGVTYIANVENYPLHEKIFVVFMVTSLVYEMMTIILFRWAHPEMEQLENITKSYQLKKFCFLLNVLFTAGLLYFFLRHRLFCEQGAFNWFSTCEYGIAVSNICYHFTAVKEFSKKEWIFGELVAASDNNGTIANNHQKQKSN